MQLLLDTELAIDTKVLTRSAKYQHLRAPVLETLRAVMDTSKTDGVLKTAVSDL